MGFEFIRECEENLEKVDTVLFYGCMLYLLPNGLGPSRTRGWPGAKPWLGGRE